MIVSLMSPQKQNILQNIFKIHNLQIIFFKIILIDTTYIGVALYYKIIVYIQKKNHFHIT